MRNKEKTKEQLIERLKEIEGTLELYRRRGINKESLNSEYFEVKELLKQK